MAWPADFATGGLLGATQLKAWTDAIKAANGAYFTQDAWAALTLENGWLNYDEATRDAAAYRKDKEGVVHVRGLIKSGTSTNGTTVATLPVGFRPAKGKHFPVANASGYAAVDVQADGKIAIVTCPGNTWLSLTGIAFFTD